MALQVERVGGKEEVKREEVYDKVDRYYINTGTVSKNRA
jgi:hypothetical protein